MSRSYHHGALADAMIEQGLASVRAHGADHVSLRSIAHALGVSPSATYNHFTDKDDLLRAVGAQGLLALDGRMAQELAVHPDDTAAAALARFSGLARAYLAFAIDETHLFQLTFGPICADRGSTPPEAGPYRRLVDALDDLDRWGLLRPGMRAGLDMTVWASTHGMATLLVEGAASPDATEEFIESLTRLITVS